MHKFYSVRRIKRSKTISKTSRSWRVNLLSSRCKSTQAFFYQKFTRLDTRVSDNYSAENAESDDFRSKTRALAQKRNLLNYSWKVNIAEYEKFNYTHTCRHRKIAMAKRVLDRKRKQSPGWAQRGLAAERAATWNRASHRARAQLQSALWLPP